MRTNGILFNKNMIDKYGHIPIGVFGLFNTSYVQLNKSRKQYNSYIVEDNIPIINTDPEGGGVPLFHELGHFALARDNRLHRDNYGFPKAYYNRKRWDDLNCEVQVIAVEANLMGHYNVADRFGGTKPGKEAKILDNLESWQTYRKAKKLSSCEMQEHVQNRINYWKSIYVSKWFFNEWERKNSLLKLRMKKYGTIVPK